jgi:hypothetical protein
MLFCSNPSTTPLSMPTAGHAQSKRISLTCLHPQTACESLICGKWIIFQSMKQKLSLGCAHHFRPTYAGANVGHPSLACKAP